MRRMILLSGYFAFLGDDVEYESRLRLFFDHEPVEDLDIP